MRRENWEQDLAALMERRRDMPFIWGATDCCQLAADLVQTMTGRALLADLPSYSTEEEADAMLAERGGLEVATAAVMAEAGIPEVAPTRATRGDLALVEVGNETPLGVVVGSRVAVAGPNGLAFVRRSMIRRAWAL